MSVIWRPTPGTRRSLDETCQRCGQLPGQRCFTIVRPGNWKKDRTRYRQPHALGELKIKREVPA